jgi:hypothetical protein
MIVLHGSFIQGGFYLWGESPVEPAPFSATRKRRKPKEKSTQPRSFPYDAGATAVLHKVFEAGLALADRDEHHTSLFLSVPTVDFVPLPSSRLIASSPESTESASLQVWAVNSLHLQPADAVELLCRCVDKEVLAPGLIVGKDLTCWAAAVRLAAGMAVGQQFLPGLVKTSNGYRACWAPVLTGGDHDRALKLAKAMPHLCRAAALESGSPPEVNPVSTLSGFIGFVVDYLARTEVHEASERVPARGRPRGSQARKRPDESIHDR